MREPCCLLGLLLLMIPVGHVVWLGLAALLRSLLPPRERPFESLSRRPRRCVRCGTAFDAADGSCPECHLDPRSNTATELRDLEAAARVVQGLLASGGLDEASCERVYRSIEARQRLLVNAGRAGARPVVEAAASVLLRIEQWLGNEAAREELDVERKRELLRGYRLLTEHDLQALSPPALLGLARLLAAVGLASRALQTYRLLVAKYPGAESSPQGAVEAGHLAFDHNLLSQARWFLERGLARPEIAATHPESVALLEYVRDRAGGNDTEEVGAPAERVPILQFAPVPGPPILVAPPAECPSPWVVQQSEHPSAAPARDAPLAPAAATSPAAAAPATPRRSLGEWLAVFMEERNVLWGEIVGGMLIVGCSIALVISLWQTLERVPFFPFLIFAALTGALLGAGFYTLSRWKLQSTSRGLLVIGMLLVPLNFLVLAGLAREQEAGLLEVATAGAGLAFFGWLAWCAGRILIRTPLAETGRHTETLFALTILAPALALLLAPHLLGPDDPAPVLAALGLLTTLAQAGVLAVVLTRLLPQPSWPGASMRGLFVLLGIATFASATALGFLLFSGPELPEALLGLAAPVAVLGLPLLVGGALVHRRVPADESSGVGRTAGTGTALLGLAVLFAAFAMALPTPWARWLIGVVNVLALATTAFALRIPLLHVPAQAYLVLLFHAGWHVSIDLDAPYEELPWSLSLLMALQLFAAEIASALRRGADARAYTTGAAVTAGLAAFWALALSAEHPAMTAAVFTLSGLAWLWANRWWRQSVVSYVGLALLFGGAWFFVDAACPERAPLEVRLWATLAHAAFCVLLLLALGLWRQSPAWLEPAYGVPARWTAQVGAAVAALLLIASVEPLGPQNCWLASAWLAALWLVLACTQTSVVHFGAFQLALGGATVSSVLAWVQGMGWQLVEPRTLHAAGIGLAGLGLCWEMARRWFGNRLGLQRLLPQRYPAVDRWLLSGLILGQALLAIAGVLPAVADELNRTVDVGIALPAGWHLGVAAAGAWILLALLVVVLLVAVRAGTIAWPAHGLLILLLTAPVLLAAGTPPDQRAAASALRWGLALAFLLSSALLWLRGPLERRWSVQLPVAALRGLLAGGAVIPVLLLTGMVAWHRLYGIALGGPLAGSVFARMGGSMSLLFPLALISATFAGHGLRDRLPHNLLAGGLLGIVSLMAGRLLQGHRVGQGIVAEHVVQALQLGAGFAWLWAMAWQFIALRREHGRSAATLIQSPLLAVQGHVGSALLGLVLLPAALAIGVAPTTEVPSWAAEAGSLGGWLILGIATAGSCGLALGRGKPLAASPSWVF